MISAEDLVLMYLGLYPSRPVYGKDLLFAGVRTLQWGLKDKGYEVENLDRVRLERAIAKLVQSGLLRADGLEFSLTEKGEGEAKELLKAIRKEDLKEFAVSRIVDDLLLWSPELC